MKKIPVSRYATIFILGVSLCLPYFANAYFGSHPGHERFENTFIKTVITTLLGITDEQKAALDELKAETKDAIEPLANEIKAFEMQETMLAEEINIDEAIEKIDKVVELKSQISSISAAAKLEGVQILTSEQRQLLCTFVGNILDLLEYIAAYPGWDEIKKFIEEYIKPVFGNICPHRIDLDLTDEQKAALEALKNETKSEIEPLVDEIKTLDILETLLAQEIDTGEATEKLNEMVGIKSQITTIVLNSKLEGAQILTPEQRAILLEKIKERREQPTGE